MELVFTKMHGIGNDYIYFDGIHQEIPLVPAFIEKISQRHTGVGSDGIIVAVKADNGDDIRMRMFNSDGSEAMMCGNGIRCFAKFCYENHLVDKKELRVQTKAGTRLVYLLFEGHEIVGARVNMSAPILDTAKIPVLWEKETMVNETITVGGKDYAMTAVSMGNPHGVVFVDSLDFDIEKIGPLFEKHELFPESINTEFVEIVRPDYVKMRVWERGSGETMACGTGACAVMYASHLVKNTETKVTVELLGGLLDISYDGKEIWMTGEASNVFKGTYVVDESLL